VRYGDVLDWHAERHGDRLLVTLESDHGPITQLSYARLRIDALAVAAWLAEQGFGAGDAVAVMLPTGSTAVCAQPALRKSLISKEPAARI
jgi:acyl-coenzyme A synthetase/AMP-(fatty) acid ligase